LNSILLALGKSKFTFLNSVGWQAVSLPRHLPHWASDLYGKLLIQQENLLVPDEQRTLFSSAPDLISYTGSVELKYLVLIYVGSKGLVS